MSSSEHTPSAPQADPQAEPQAEPQAGATAGAAPTRAPMGRHVALLVVVALLVALDLWSKSAVFSWFQDPEAQAALPRSERGHPRYPILGEWLGFMLNLNYGAAFGKGGSMPWLLVGGRCVAAVFLSFLIVRTPTGQRVYLSALVLILSGALGNLYDNFTFAPTPDLPGVQEGRPFGPVRDFIDVYFHGWDWHFPTFNVADSCITVGAILLLLSGLGGGRGAAASSAGSTAGSTAASTAASTAGSIPGAPAEGPVGGSDGGSDGAPDPPR